MDHRIPDEEILDTIAERFTAELRAGNNPSVAQYQSEYPELSEEIDSVLSSIVMIEQLKHSSSASNLHARLLQKVADLRQIDSYRILREIGRGGMGIVFAAEHEALGRRVAIKVLPVPVLDATNVVERFRREAQAAAKLHHTNIVGVFGVGQGEGYCYYVMDLVEGQSLSQVIAAWQAQADHLNTVDYRWLASLGANLADALSYAHACGILHRDIKPSNLLLDQQRILWITDFGLAKDLSSSSELTRIGDVVGTPQYLPPESLDGAYDQRSEVYGVGLILYELTTLKPAYPGGSPAELIRAIATRSPDPVLKVNSSIPLDLATIIDKALSRDPNDRYQTAEDLKHDLTAFVEGRSISARRPRLLETAGRWAKRNPLAAGLAGVSIVLLGLVAVTASLGYWTASQALKKEAEIAQSLREQQQATESARIQAEQNLVKLEQQHQRAESNLSLSMEAFEEMFKAVVARGVPSGLEVDMDGYRELSGIETTLTKQDAEFLDRMVDFYEQFASLNSDNESLSLESAKAYRRLGNIYQLIGQMSPAVEAYEKSLELLPTSQSDSADAKTLLLTRVKTRHELSNALRRKGAPVKAQQMLRDSINDLEDSPLYKNDAEVRLELARSMSALGINLSRVLAISPPTLPDKKDSRESGTAGADGPGVEPTAADRRLENMDAASRFRQRTIKPLNRQAIEILDGLLAEDPNNAEAIAVRATCYWNLAAANWVDNPALGIQHRSKAIGELEELAQKLPEKAEYQYLLSLACGLVASNGGASELELLERGSEVAFQLLERYPAMLDYHLLYVNHQVKQASYHMLSGDSKSAYQELRVARDSVQTLLKRSTSDRSFSMTIGSLVRELQLLSRELREKGNLRWANEATQYLTQIRNSRKSSEKLSTDNNSR